MSEVRIKISGDTSSAKNEIRSLKNSFQQLKAAAGNFSTSFSRAVGSSVRRSFSRMRGWITGLKTAFNSLMGTIKRIFGSLSTLVGALALGLLLKQIHQVTSAFIAVDNALGAVVGTSGEADQAMNFLIGTGQRLGADIQTLARAYLKFNAAGKESRSTSEELHEMFIALAETGTILQFTSQELEGAFRALTQMMSKGKVQAEELRGQLGEHLPGAFEIAAKSMGLTTRELDNMLKKGEITADMLVRSLPQGLRDAYGSALPGAIVTARAEFNRLGNDIKIFLENNKEQIDAVFKKIASSLRELFNNVQRSGLLQWMVDTNTGFDGMLQFISEIPQQMEIIILKAKAFYDTTMLELQQFQLRFKEFIGTISQEEQALLRPQIDPVFGFGGQSFSAWMEEEINDPNAKGFLENYFDKEMEAVESNLSASIRRIQEKYKEALPRVSETSGALPPVFQTGSGVPDPGEEMKQFEINQRASFERSLAQMQGLAELEMVIYKQFIEKITKLKENNLITEEEFYLAQELAFADHNLRMNEIEEDALLQSMANRDERINQEARGWSLSAKLAKESLDFQRKTTYETTGDILNLFQGMTAGLAANSKSAFEFNKALSIGIALIKGYEAVVSSYAAGARIGGPYLGAAFAAIAATATAMQIRQISQTSFGDTQASTGSFAGTGYTASPLTTPIDTSFEDEDESRQINIYVTGEWTSDGFRLAVVDAVETAEANDEIIIRNVTN